MKCRHCQEVLSLKFLDLETSPPSNSYLTQDQLSAPEKWYPLRVYTCTKCWLVQTEDYAHFSEFFGSNYAYYSSFSSEWLNHAKKYVNQMAERLSLTEDSKVVEVASNDGYLLQYLVEKRIPCLGIEPTHGTANAARAKGIEVVEDFFGVELAKRLVEQGHAADLTVANNVLAHVPDINDFVSGFAHILKPNGVSTFEFPHLKKLVEHCQFDTVYHEHFSYLSLSAVEAIFAHSGLTVFDVELLSTHGGSLRVFAQRTDTGKNPRKAAVDILLEAERSAGMCNSQYYSDLQQRADKIKDELLLFLIERKRSKEQVVAYGAAAKGNTLLNYAGVRTNLLSYVVDRNPFKEGKFLPGNRIPIVSEARLMADRPDYVLILPWNLSEEIGAQLSYIRDWGGKLVTAIPNLTVF